MLDFNDLIERITGWATEHPDVRAALILGSRARTDHPADEWSDLDILVFTHQPEQFIQSAEWAKAIAPAWLSFSERTGDGQSWERRTLYAGGLDVDVAVNPVEWLDTIQAEIPPVMADVIRRGCQDLVDRNGKLRRILSLPLPQASLFRKTGPTGFYQCHQRFLVSHPVER